MSPAHRHIFRQLVSRSIRTGYLHNLTGFAWLFLQPLMLLAVYAFVFTTIFKARVTDAADVGFVPYLAVAFWPWTAFSESVLKSSGAITAHAALVGKVAFPSELLPLSTVTATFLMHLAGFLAVLIVLQLIGTEIRWTGLLTAVPVLVLLWALACGLGLLFSATQVFVRDLAQILPPLMTFWFFMTPILYSQAMLPEGLAQVMQWNPMNWFVGRLRESLLFGGVEMDWNDLLPFAATILLFWLALKYFRRFAGHFEDFL